MKKKQFFVSVILGAEYEVVDVMLPNGRTVHLGNLSSFVDFVRSDESECGVTSVNLKTIEK